MHDEFLDDEQDSDPDDLDYTTIACPNCNEEVFEDSPRCPNCGEYISDQTRTYLEGKPKWFFWLIVIIIAILVLTFTFPF